MSLIRDFTDFHLLRLQLTDGVMVLGFAKRRLAAGARGQRASPLELGAVLPMPRALRQG